MEILLLLLIIWNIALTVCLRVAFSNIERTEFEVRIMEDVITELDEEITELRETKSNESEKTILHG